MLSKSWLSHGDRRYCRASPEASHARMTPQGATRPAYTIHCIRVSYTLAWSRPGESSWRGWLQDWPGSSAGHCERAMTSTTFWLGAFMLVAVILVGLGAALLASLQVLGPHSRRAARGHHHRSVGNGPV